MDDDVRVFGMDLGRRALARDWSAVQAMLVPFPSERMTVRPVSTFVNNARNEGPECLAAD